MSSLLDLAVVIPVYNEEGCIRTVLESWIRILNNLKINFNILVLNDGSVDGTSRVLAEFKSDLRFKIIEKANSGHGPTILMGYKKAVSLAEWTFQCDGDDEIQADSFPLLWQQRFQFDAIFGSREARIQSLDRRFLSVASRWVVTGLFKSGVLDVNVPYRLIRSTVLKKLLEQIPENTFAPNVIISGAIALSDLRIQNISVRHVVRRTGRVSLQGLRTIKAGLKVFMQTLHGRSSISVIKTES